MESVYLVFNAHWPSPYGHYVGGLCSRLYIFQIESIKLDVSGFWSPRVSPQTRASAFLV